MDIERLNKAASAAGFAMATPDDEDVAVKAPLASGAPDRARALVPVSQMQNRFQDVPGLSGMRDWFKSYLPTLGWKAPA